MTLDLSVLCLCPDSQTTLLPQPSCTHADAISCKSNPTSVNIHLVLLTELNLGNNSFEALPEVLKHLRQLRKLHLFDNKLEALSPNVLECLENLTFLNLNKNKLTTLPEEICRLAQLKYLTVNNNQLESVPSKLCLLQHLCELHLAHNKLKSLPHDIGYLTNLKKLSVPRNEIQVLPEELCVLRNLKVLDVAGNQLHIFPTKEMCKSKSAKHFPLHCQAVDKSCPRDQRNLLYLKLEEFYYEQNPLLEKDLITSTQMNEVLTLQEITARYILNGLSGNSLSEALEHYPEARKILAHASLCAVCKRSFLNTWLECVSFVDLAKKISITSPVHVVPIRALLCSYKCFNESGHQFYGIAIP
ncbi:leucine-rich repeat-containing protein 69 isoform X3 [Chiloscyllium plagiosum]|uniref:leucine-rich repeat-containing protein 69 isoform X3 n=1 Tax=Chiloscyllium plagiosum TaxID=36176 RepID=UPI001CB863A1|nr:leucine-rich repeat-containing protein 69 isoform X3 [Chiloscyllium plagiosum]